MRLISILAGIAMGFAATVILLQLAGSAGRPVGLLIMAPAVLAGALTGVGTARQVDARETRLDARRAPGQH